MEKTPDRVQIILATEADIPAVLEHIRPQDREELARYGLSEEAALRLAVRGSVGSWLGKVDGETVCLFGLQRGSFLLPDLRPWMVGTQALDRHPLTVLRRSRIVLEKMLQVFPRLAGHVWAGNVRSTRWLQWLGFTVGPVRRTGTGEYRHFTKGD